MMKKLLLAILLIAPFLNTNAQLEIVNNNLLQESVPIELNSKFYLPMFTSATGYELFEFDGTDAGTVLVKDISSGSSSSFPQYLTVFNNKLYFVANDGINGGELWETDGTEAGTNLVKDSRAGSSGSNPNNLIVFNNKLFFTANDGINGTELWESDGTEAGTKLVKDIKTGISSSFISEFTIFNNKLYFTAEDASNGLELWQTDGTTSGTILFADISTTNSTFTAYLTVFNSKLYFIVSGEMSYSGIWETDGTVANTNLVVPSTAANKLNPATFLFEYDNKLYFSGEDASGNSGLWATDGTNANKALVKNINTSGGADIVNLIVFNDKLYFVADNGIDGRELWSTDGTTVGTNMVIDLATDEETEGPEALTVFNNRLYFIGSDDTSIGLEIYETKGTEASTKLLTDINTSGDSDPFTLFVFNNKLYFNADDGSNTNFYQYTPPLEITSTTPSANSNNVLQESNIVLNFSGATFASNVNTNTIKVSGSQTGAISGVFSGADTNQITFNPTNNLKPGETITVTLTNGISIPYTFRFTAKVPVLAVPFTPTDTPLLVGETTNAVSDYHKTLTGDLNKDGFTDIIAFDRGRINWFLHNGDSNPTFNKYETADLNSINPFRIDHLEVKLVDINNDGFLDIITSSFGASSGFITWFENNGNAVTGFTEHIVATVSSQSQVDAGDIDADGDIDIITANLLGEVTWYKNNGAATPVFTTQLLIDDNRINDPLHLIDLDNDGFLDVVYITFNTASSLPNEIIWLQNNGESNPTFTRTVIHQNEFSIEKIAIVDANNNGFLDIAFLEINRLEGSGLIIRSLRLLENNTTSSIGFTKKEFPSLVIPLSTKSFLVASDIDGDNDIDFLAQEEATGKIVWLQNDGANTPNFTNSIIYNEQAVDITTVDIDNDGDVDIISLNIDEEIEILKSTKAINTFLGTTNNLWSTTTNWSFGTLPIATEEIKINTATTANIDVAAVANSITIEGTLNINAGKSLTISGDIVQNGTFSIQSDATASGSFIASGTFSGSGKIDYYRYVTENWQMISVPVDFVFVNTIEADVFSKIETNEFGSYTKFALAPYENNLGDGLRYNYYTDFMGPNNISSVGPFQRARGYSSKRKTAGTYKFSGGYFSNSAIFSLDDSSGSGGTKWNLVGNPYTSFLALNSDADATNNFLTVNGANLDPARVAIYLWNANTSSYDIINHATGVAKYAAPGQGFFVQAKDGASTLATFTPAMQSVQEGDFFLKSANNIPEIQVSITTGKETKTTEIKYFENATTGLDVGFDAGVFSESSDLLAIYTQLITNNTGIDFALQCLPKKDVETFIIPLGINAKANTQFTISAKSFHLTEGLNVYLEDRENNIFINLSEADFSSTIKTDLKGVGRFFLHTSSKVLSTDTLILNKNISIYRKDNYTLTIVGLYQSDANLQLFNILGKSVFTTNLNGTGKNDVSLPNLKLGVYLVSLKTDTGNINKKIILE